MKYKPQLLELRQRIPIGFSEAIQLLKGNSNEPRQAELIWKAKQAEILSEQISVSQPEAKELLEFVRYESDKAIRIYQKRKTTNVVQILEADRNEERTLFFFWETISHHLGKQIPYGEWRNKKGFSNLPEVIQEVLLVWQWLTEFDRNNGFVEQGFTASFLQILESKFEMKEFANRIQSTDSKHKNLAVLEKKIQGNEELIMNRSFEYLYNHVTHRTILESK